MERDSNRERQSVLADPTVQQFLEGSSLDPPVAGKRQRIDLVGPSGNSPKKCGRKTEYRKPPRPADAADKVMGNALPKVMGNASTSCFVSETACSSWSRSISSNAVVRSRSWFSGRECFVAPSFFLFLGRVSASPGEASFVLCFVCGVWKGGSSQDGLLADVLASFVEWPSSLACMSLKISFFFLMKRHWAAIGELTMAGGNAVACSSWQPR